MGSLGKAGVELKTTGAAIWTACQETWQPLSTCKHGCPGWHVAPFWRPVSAVGEGGALREQHWLKQDRISLK